MFESRISTKNLAILCRRLSLSLGAGVDVRTVWARESLGLRGPAHQRFAEVSDSVAQGDSISAGIAGTGNYFPVFFRELVKVGEQTGHLPEVFHRLAEHYETQLQLRRRLATALTWPVIELFLAQGVIGLLILVMGWIPKSGKDQIDILGFGLVGSNGLMIYLMILAAFWFGVFMAVRAASRGALWVAPLQRALMKVPKLGKAFETIAMARLSWAMHVTLNSGMDLRAALKLALDSTQNVLYTQHTSRILKAIQMGDEVHEALAATHAFPQHFVDIVQIGEQSGRLVESLATASVQYQQEAKSAMQVLTVLLGLAVTALIAGIIIFMIFRVAGFYIGVINDAAKPF